MEPSSTASTTMLQRIQHGARTSEVHAARLKRVNTWLVWLSLTGTSLATILAAATAVAGPVAGEGPPAWRRTCGAIAVLTALSSLLSGAHSRLNVSERRARAHACTGRLRSLELGLAVSGRDVREVAGDYEEVVASYQELLV